MFTCVWERERPNIYTVNKHININTHTDLYICIGLLEAKQNPIETELNN